MTNLIKGTKAADANQSVVLIKNAQATHAYYGKVISKTALRTIVEIEVHFGTLRVYFTSRKGLEHYGHQFSKTVQYKADKVEYPISGRWDFQMYEDSAKTETLVAASVKQIEDSRLSELASLKKVAQNKLLEMLAKTESMTANDFHNLIRSLNNM